MAWTVILEDENGKQLDKLSVEFADMFFDNLNRNDFRILKYLDPYGDTIFNTLQAEDLLTDLIFLKDNGLNKVVIEELVAIVNKLTHLPHTYIVFYGD